MRIVCDGCQAKYSIADDKVRAKVFKIRCKKCSNVIVVRGGDAVEPATPPAPVEDDAIWHLVIDQEQVGPMTAGEVEQRFASGGIDGETFTWREGMDEWLPLAQVDAFANLTNVATVATAAPRAPSPRMREPDHQDDLFGSHPRGTGSPDGSLAQMAAAPAESAAQKLRGERNESSVLFSLGNLAQIANHRPAPAAATPAAGSATAGGGEGSGLIDIRSMASAYLGSPGAAVQSRTASAGIGSLDDLPVFGGGGFSEPAVLVPSARPATNSKLLYIMIGAVALLATVAIVLMVMLLGGNKSAPQVAAATPPPAVEPKHVVETPPPPPPVTPPATPPAEIKAPVAAPPPVVAPKQPKELREPRPKEPKEPKAHAQTPPPPPIPDQLKATKDTCDDISCAVTPETPCCQARQHTGAAPTRKVEVDPNLPPKLVVGQITSTMATVKAKIMSCGDRSPAKGTVKVHLKVNGDGKVSDASVETSPDAALGACVAAAAKRAVFPKTQTGGSFGIPYQF